MAHDLIVQNTDYPNSKDTATALATNDDVEAQHINGPASAVVAIEGELGIGLRGALTDLAERLNINIADDGGIPRGTVFPVSPPAVPHLFWRSDLATLYVYNVTEAQYSPIAGVSVLSVYVRKDVPTTITAVHTFNPASAGAPFLLGANALAQKVTGLKADTVASNPDTAGAANGVATLGSGSKVVQDAQNLVVFSAYLSANQSVSAGAWTILHADVEDVDTHSYYNNGTYTFNPQLAGYYLVQGTVRLLATGNIGTQLSISIRKNSADYATKYLAMTSATITEAAIDISAIVYLNGTTDIVQLFAANSGATSPVFVGGGAPRESYFSAVRVSP